MSAAAKTVVAMAVTAVGLAAGAVGLVAASAAPHEDRLSAFGHRTAVVDALTSRCGVSIADRNGLLAAMQQMQQRGWASAVLPLQRHRQQYDTRVVVLTGTVSTHDTTTGAHLCTASS